MIVPGVAAITTIYDEMLSPEYFRYSCWSLGRGAAADIGGGWR